MGAAVVLTILSMVDYFRSAADVLVGPWTGEGQVTEVVSCAEDLAEDRADETVD